MVFADNIADDAEKKLMKRLIVGLGFPSNEIEAIIEKSFTEIQNGSDEDEFVSAFS